MNCCCCCCCCCCCSVVSCLVLVMLCYVILTLPGLIRHYMCATRMSMYQCSLQQGLTMAPKPPAQKLPTLALDRAPRSIVLVAPLATLVHEVDLPDIQLRPSRIGRKHHIGVLPLQECIAHNDCRDGKRVKGHVIPYPVLNVSCHKPSKTTNRISQP